MRIKGNFNTCVFVISYVAEWNRSLNLVIFGEQIVKYLMNFMGLLEPFHPYMPGPLGTSYDSHKQKVVLGIRCF